MWLRACQGEKKGRAGAPEKGLHNVSTWVARWNSPTKLTGKSQSLKCSQSPTISHKHLQEKTSRVNRFAQQIGLNISLKKTEVMTLITQNLPSIQINGINIPTTEEFSYLGSTVRYDGGTGNDIKSRLNKARNIFRMMNNVLKSTKYSINTKLKLYTSCVLSTLLFSSECWRMTEKNLSKISAFHTRNLRIILRIFWPNTISNQQLLARTNQESIKPSLQEGGGDGLATSCEKNRTTLQEPPYTGPLKARLAQNRQEWRSFVAALHASRHKGQ